MRRSSLESYMLYEYCGVSPGLLFMVHIKGVETGLKPSTKIL